MERLNLDDIHIERTGYHGPLTDIVYTEMFKRIECGQWPTNVLLPREEELAVIFKVSRTVIREALARLRSEGMIVSKRGSGSRITGKPRRSIFDAAHPHSISDLGNCYDFRIGFEPQAAYLAALRGNQAAFERIESAHERLSACITSDRLGAEEDIEFHMAISAATENDYYIKTIIAIAKPVEVGLLVAKTLSDSRASERFAPTIDEHARIMKAILTRKAEAARQYMLEHIEASRRRVFLGLS